MKYFLPFMGMIVVVVVSIVLICISPMVRMIFVVGVFILSTVFAIHESFTIYRKHRGG